MITNKVKKYIKKPITIEAFHFTNLNTDTIDDLMEFMHEDTLTMSVNSVDICTLEGTMIASLGDYIIKGVHGEFYPCKPDIFEETYNEVK